MSAALFFCASCAKEGAVISGVDEIVVVPTLGESKATLVPAGNLQASRIHIDAYNATSGEKHIDGNILCQDGKWMFYTDVQDVHYYWPQNSNLDVLAYCPVKLEKTCIEVTSKNTVRCTGLPMAGELQDDKLLEEFICGYKGGCKKADGTISVTLKRPFAVVNFYLEDAVRCTLNTIEITGIFNQGVYAVETGAWSSLDGKSDFVCTVGKEYPTEINAGFHLGGPFLVVPQSLRPDETDTAVKLRLNYRSKGNTKDTITETKLGQAGLDEDYSVKVGSWECGKRYDYYISLNGAANEVRMSVQVVPWSIEGNSEIDVK